MKNCDDIMASTNIENDLICKKSNMMSNLRLLFAIIGIVFFVVSIMEKRMDIFIFFVLSCIVFMALLVYHEKVKSKKEYLMAKLKVLQKRTNRKENKWSEFEDKGNDFLGEKSLIEKDLDIFGNNSLFQYLCIANTHEGRKTLASYLRSNKFDKKILCLRQDAVRELSKKEELGLEIEILSMIIGMNSKSKSKEWYNSFTKYLNIEKKLISTFVSIVANLLPIIMFMLLIFMIKRNIRLNFFYALGVIQLTCAYFVSYKCKGLTSNVYNFCMNIEGYYKLIQCIQNADFESEYLMELRSRLSGKNEATKGIEKLNYLNDAFSVQRNPYVHIFLQLFFMYDIHCIKFLERWKKKYAAGMIELFSIIGDVEALLSLAVISNNREVCFPEFTDENIVLFNAESVAHPLISLQSVVSNSFRIEKGIGIITGSNMSGKTTFMRTIGINTILAYAGAPVCARNMKLSFMKLYTSMRVQDDVSKGLSSFYAEVLRIKEMVEYSKKKKPMLVLIDEIFKGTNSIDRIAGAKEIIKMLNREHIITLLSTHDFELCGLVEQKEIKGYNYHFQEYYKANEIYFDYQIKDGKCKTSNAKYILKMAGLVN